MLIVWAIKVASEKLLWEVVSTTSYFFADTGEKTYFCLNQHSNYGNNSTYQGVFVRGGPLA